MNDDAVCFSTTTWWAIKGDCRSSYAENAGSRGRLICVRIEETVFSLVLELLVRDATSSKQLTISLLGEGVESDAKAFTANFEPMLIRKLLVNTHRMRY